MTRCDCQEDHRERSSILRRRPSSLRGRGVRAGHRGVAAGSLVGQATGRGRVITADPVSSAAGSAGPAPSRPSSARRRPRSPTASRACCSSARPDSSDAVPGRDDGRADRLPERGRAGGVRRARAAEPAPGRRRAITDGAHARASWRVAIGWSVDLIAGADFTAGRVDARSRWSSSPPRATVTRTRSSAAVTAQPAYVGLVGSRKRGEAVLGYLADRGLPQDLLDRVQRAGGPRPRPHRAPRRSPWRSSPSSCSFARVGALSSRIRRGAVPAQLASRVVATNEPNRSARWRQRAGSRRGG